MALYYLCAFAAVISAHPIHSLDNHHHHYHLGSLASPTRGYLHHQSSTRSIATPISHLDRAESTGESALVGLREGLDHPWIQMC